MSNKVKMLQAKQFGYGFIEEAYIPQGKDEYYLRNQMVGSVEGYRNLTPLRLRSLRRI